MKNLKIAEIVPVSCLDYTENNQYHMCLAHLVSQSEEYTEFFRRMSDEGKFVLMDNGAAEDSQLSFEELIDSYKIINPTEVVLPDSLCDSEDTIRKSVLFYNTYEKELNGKRLMVVPQGKTFEEWCKCAVDLMTYIPVDTIGVSKFLEMVTKDPEVRIKCCEFLKRYNVEIHLLGCSEGPRVPLEARGVNDHVRGCDSAFVYICAKAGLDSIDVTTTRPDSEIDFLNDPDQAKLVPLMMDFEYSAGIKDNMCDETWRN